MLVILDDHLALVNHLHSTARHNESTTLPPERLGGVGQIYGRNIPGGRSQGHYIDFEGNQDLPPSLLGIRWRAGEQDHFEQFVIEEALYPVVGGSAKTTHAWPKAYARVEAVPTDSVAAVRASDSLTALASKLVTRAESEQRLLVSWSRHERDVICSILVQTRA